MIRKILVANRGEIARRVFRTCRDLGIETVAIHSDPDVSEPHASEADMSILLPGSTSAETYLNSEAILAAARKSGADAIHPGYGFLAENSTFARAVTAAGLTWIGPSPEAIEQMGSKLEAKRLIEDAGVSVLPGRDLTGLSREEMADIAQEIGYPVLVKANSGGGGKGMRVVADESGLSDAVGGASREAENSFGDGSVFLEKYLDAPRHIEIQVFGDSHGNIVSLFERDCSIQRRHQKIVEESPSPALTSLLRSQMGEAAVAAARAVDYQGAGTVEFLFQDGRFYFLEMNTRLQVEHPVTEMVTGLDLVELQIAVANGGELPERALSPSIEGHAIEVRLYAEDPANEFLPVTGKIHDFTFDLADNLRVDSGVGPGSNISVHYDPMLAKIIAHAPTRTGAAGILATALRQARIHGSTTNRSLLVRILEHPEFLRGDIDTHFLDRHHIENLAAPLASEADEAHAARAAALSDQAIERARARVLGTLPSGWRNLRNELQSRAYQGELAEHHVAYHLEDNAVVFEGEDHASLITSTPERVEFDRCGTLYQFDVARYGELRYVDSPQIPVRLVAVDRFPASGEDEIAGSLHSPLPGKIVRVEADVGDRVAAGEVLIVIEAMKMEHTIRSPYAGTIVRLDFGADDQVEADAVLVVVEPETGQ